MAVTSYATAAELSSQGTRGNSPHAGRRWEHAAQAAIANGDYAAAVGHADRAREYHLAQGDSRAAARAQATAGQALRPWGRHAEARQLVAALEVLRTDPDADTVRALDGRDGEVFAGSPDADRLSSEALMLGQALGVGLSQLTALFEGRGLYHAHAGRRPQAVAYPPKPPGSPSRSATT